MNLVIIIMKVRGSPFQMQHKFDSYRSTVGESKNLKAKFKAALQN